MNLTNTKYVFMDTENKIKLTFQVETKRIIEILSTEIYDSPLALLRENLQNAYDAVLMRKEEDVNFNPEIRLTVEGKRISIVDNGIGMTLEVLRNNFWKAGSSGKRNNAIAKRAGVIGTFGIGAMANFGVCDVLEITTTSIDSEFTFYSKAVRDELKIGEDCIETVKTKNNGKIGTSIVATLDEASNIDLQTCINYLKPYIEYLPVPVYINEVKYSQNLLENVYNGNLKNAQNVIPDKTVSNNGFTYSLSGYVLANSFLNIKISNITFNSNISIGEIFLSQGATNIMCYRNYFGLSSTPVSNGYNLGGYANLSFLTPTAGREALSRESVALLANLIDSIEREVTYIISDFEIANLNVSFQKYIVNKSLMDLGGKITIRVSPENVEIPLINIPSHNDKKSKSFYTGSNPESIKIFASENNDLYLPSPSNPRRQIQLYFLSKSGVRQQGDEVQIIKKYDKRELTIAEGTLLFKIDNVITEDYLIKDVSVQFAEISHGVTSRVSKEGDLIIILISKSSKSIQQLCHYYNVDYSVLGGFVKDYVRAELYNKFSAYVPSATKSGADALHKILLKNRELFKIDVEEQGELDAVIDGYLHNNTSLSEVAKKMSTITSGHTQTLRANQIGTLEATIPDLIHLDSVEVSPVIQDRNFLYDAMPPILRLDQDTDNLKLLRTTSSVRQLNSFKLFIALSEKLYKRDKDFFFEPHTTKIIWGNHKIVYIFGHISNKITLYYDIELKESIVNNPLGGDNFPTTTIITSDKIFIPIQSSLEEAFFLNEKNRSKEFYIRYDLVTETS
jgi:molecular chaperone HtpG